METPAPGGNPGRAVDRSDTSNSTAFIIETPASSGGNRLPVLAGEIERNHVLAVRAGREFVRHAIDAGRLLLEAKALVPHGEWAGWLAEHVPDVSTRTCQRYMKAAKSAGKSDTCRFSSLRHLIGSKRRGPRVLAGYKGDLERPDTLTVIEIEPVDSVYAYTTLMLPTGELIGAPRPMRLGAVDVMMKRHGVDVATLQWARVTKSVVGLHDMLLGRLRNREELQSLSDRLDVADTVEKVEAILADLSGFEAQIAAEMEAAR